MFDTAPRIVIGRSPECDVVVDDEYASLFHCVVAKVNNQLWVYDIGSTNGTFVRYKSGAQYQVVGWTLIEQGDTLIVGRKEFPWSGV